jgi:hypothetical protein
MPYLRNGDAAAAAAAAAAHEEGILSRDSMMNLWLSDPFSAMDASRMECKPRCKGAKVDCYLRDRLLTVVFDHELPVELDLWSLMMTLHKFRSASSESRCRLVGGVVW